MPQDRDTEIDETEFNAPAAEGTDAMPEAPDDAPMMRDASSPLIIGIGASAGGLEAFQTLLSHLPERHDLALVLVQHLDPDHESLLPELLSKRTHTPVQSITDGMEVRPGNIYLIPPGSSLTLDGTTLHLEAFDSPRGLRRPIDKFLVSLAASCGPNATGIILSGTGSDGSVGVKAIKEAGGLVFVQDPKQAKYDGMPRSALATGAVDLVLPSSEMVDVVNDYYNRRSGIEPSIRNDAEFIERVAKHVRYRTGHDFAHYKEGTFLRRLAVRMSVLGIDAPSDYLKELIDNKAEAGRLFRDLLINVTAFFRDNDAFEALRDNVLPKMIQARERDEEIRVWVPGCSTGQEAYSIAILLAEEVRRVDAGPRMSIFGTDIDDEALRVARRGIYPNSIADEVPAEFLERYFRPTPGGYEVAPSLRDIVRFSNQSIIKDPPFSKLDLVSCRNVTIYFDQVLQELAIRVFHYALREGGFLFIGPSENPPVLQRYFADLVGPARLFQRRAGPARPLNLPNVGLPTITPSVTGDSLASDFHQRSYEQALLAGHVPPYLLLNLSNEVIYASEGAAKYLQVKPGATKTGLLHLIRPELEGVTRRLINLQPERGERSEREYQGEVQGKMARIVLSLERLEDDTTLLVLRDYLDIREDRPGHRDTDDNGITDYVRDLEEQLDGARQTIRTTVEELETSNEELKSSNEEMMSMNEELQSANEELSTINEELQNKVAELNEVNSDLSNFIRSTRIPTVFLDDDLRLRSFTPEAQAYFRFVELDRGRRIDDIGSDISMVTLVGLAEAVLSTGDAQEAELQTTDGLSELVLRVLPYRTEGAPPSGVIFTLTNVTELRTYAREIEHQRALAQKNLAEIEELYRVSPQAMALVDSDLRFLRVNQRMAEIDGTAIEEHYGRTIREIMPRLSDELAGPVATVLRTGEPVLDRRISGHTDAFPEEERVWEVDWYPIAEEGGSLDGGPQVRAVGLNVRDVTHQADMSRELQRVMKELQHRVKNMLSNVLALVNRARREAETDTEVFETLAKRIEALANTHRLLTTANWGAARVRAILEPELTDVYGADRVQLRGPDLLLNARATLAVGMAVHELATNAAKYGAFSNSVGTVSLSWSRIDEGEGERVRLVWTEQGGPRVTGRGEAGFGSQLISSTIEGGLEGKVEMDWRQEGLRCVMEFDYAIARESLREPGADAAE
ncbi:MAG: chemotaxis protein CheB [Pseudomonadota bacterium]